MESLFKSHRCNVMICQFLFWRGVIPVPRINAVTFANALAEPDSTPVFSFEEGCWSSSYLFSLCFFWINHQHLPKGAVWTLGDAGWCCIGTPNIIDLAPLGRSRYDMCFVFPSGTVFSSEPATYLHIRYLYWSCLRFSSISKNYQLVSTQHVQPLTSCFVPP